MPATWAPKTTNDGAGGRTGENDKRTMHMKTILAYFIGLALAASAFTVAAQECPGGGKGQGGGAGKDCPNYSTCPGPGQGQQHRYGWGKGQGQGQGKGYRGGARDGSGPKRDGSGGQCPNKI